MLRKNKKAMRVKADMAACFFSDDLDFDLAFFGGLKKKMGILLSFFKNWLEHLGGRGGPYWLILNAEGCQD